MRIRQPVIIVDAFLSKMESMPKPSASNPVEKAEHFMTLRNIKEIFFKEIDEVSDEAGIDVDAYKQ